MASRDQVSKNIGLLREPKSTAWLLESRRIALHGSSPALVRRGAPNVLPSPIPLPRDGRHRHVRKNGRKVFAVERFGNRNAARRLLHDRGESARCSPPDID